MKTLKIILLIIGVIILVPMMMAIFISKDYTVEREIVIDKPKAEVFDFVKYLKNQDQYNKWIRMDAELKKDFSGVDGSVGSIYHWDGDKAGKGEQKITDIVDGERLATELHFIKPWEGIAQAQIRTEEVTPDRTKVSWSMTGESFYPMNFMNLFTDGLLGGDLEESLLTLKNVLEKSPTSTKN
jgi:hypothetical protein